MTARNPLEVELVFSPGFITPWSELADYSCGADA